MSIAEYIRELIETAPAPGTDQSPFGNGWDCGYKRGLEAALDVAKALETK